MRTPLNCVRPPPHAVGKRVQDNRSFCEPLFGNLPRCCRANHLRRREPPMQKRGKARKIIRRTRKENNRIVLRRVLLQLGTKLVYGLLRVAPSRLNNFLIHRDHLLARLSPRKKFTSNSNAMRFLQLFVHSTHGKPALKKRLQQSVQNIAPNALGRTAQAHHNNTSLPHAF